MPAPQDVTKGIWFPEDYEIALKANLLPPMREECKTGCVDENFFIKESDFTFRVKKDIKPSEALNKFLEGPTVCDKGVLEAAIFYATIKDQVGEEIFDDMFRKFRVTDRGIYSDKIYQYIKRTKSADAYYDYRDSKINDRLHITNQHGKSSYEAHYDYKQVTAQTDKFKYKNNPLGLGRRPLNIGDHCHFSGVRGSFFKHSSLKYIHKSHESLIYIGDNENGEQSFLGHSSRKGPLTEYQINLLFLEEYNKPLSQEDEKVLEKEEEDTKEFYDKNKNPWLKKILYYF